MRAEPVVLPPLNPAELPRPFLLCRSKDHSGLSGIGVVATGVAFPDGITVVRWRGYHSGIHQLEIFTNPDDLTTIHGHRGSSELLWLPCPTLRQGTR
jgi:hypothetical protein